MSTYRSLQSLWGGSSGWVWWVLKGQSEVTEGGWQRGRGLRGCLRCSPLLLCPSPSTKGPQQGTWEDMQQKYMWWDQQKSKRNTMFEIRNDWKPRRKSQQTINYGERKISWMEKIHVQTKEREKHWCQGGEDDRWMTLPDVLNSSNVCFCVKPLCYQCWLLNLHSVVHCGTEKVFQHIQNVTGKHCGE